MKWDESVLRKFNSTSHYRLLNQVRSEVKLNKSIKNDTRKDFDKDIKTKSY